MGDVDGDGQPEIVYADFGRDDLVLLSIGCLVAPTPQFIVEDASCGSDNGTIAVDTSDFNDPTFSWDTGAATATIADLSAGEYTVTITDANGCTATGSVTITELPIAEIELAGTDTSCGNEDGTATVEVLSGTIDAINWSTGATTATIEDLAGGTYSVVVTDENGCQIEQTIDVRALLNPTVDLGEDIMLPEGELVTLDASGDGLTYTRSTGETSPSIMVSMAGTYTVTVTNADGCTASDEVVVTVVTDVEELRVEDYFSIQPNPTNGLVSISSDGQTKFQSIRVLSFTGRELRFIALDQQQTSLQLDLSDLPAGSYLLQVDTGQRTYLRLVVKH